MPVLRIALAQIDATVGAFRNNINKIIEKINEARNAGADLVVFPELALCGYPPEDLLLKPSFVHACRQGLNQVIEASVGITAVVGFPEKEGNELYNSAAIICDRQLVRTYHKHDLPNYGVFDEERYFTSARKNLVFLLDGIRFGVTICEDIWNEKGPHHAQAVSGGGNLLINISASPYHRGKPRERETMLSQRARNHNVFVAYCNLVGGQDELVFDGGSTVFNPSGNVIARAAQFKEDLLLVDLVIERIPANSHAPIQHPSTLQAVELPLRIKNKSPLQARTSELLGDLDEVYQALILGTKEYIVKNNFSKVVLGLSGGIDSALAACIAADALGPANVTGVSLPSRYSSDHSKSDAAALARNLKLHYLTIPIEPVYSAFLNTLESVFAGTHSGIAEENLQSRIRGTILMALSNKFGWLVLATGNKSEMSVGYATLYGDMAGGFAVIKDLPKTLVYDLCKHRNARSPVIPENVFTKPPSAELRPDQKDTDSLPDYSILDPILQAYVEHNASLREIISKGFSPEVVKRVVQLVDRAEYKRRQAPPGVKITQRGLGKDWRLPLTNHFDEKVSVDTTS